MAFDIEIAKEIPAGETDWKKHRPLGISCAATHNARTGETRAWHGVRMDVNGPYPERMTPQEVVALARYLSLMDGKGVPIVTWNGLGFDFDILAEECRDPAWAGICRGLALSQIDVAFAMFCDKGFMVGLDAASKGMGLSGKTEGMHGDLAPVMWAQGPEEQEKVLEYVQQDVRATAELYQVILERRQMKWITRSGRVSAYPWLPAFNGEGHLLRVAEALDLPLPDTSWMDEPWPREKFTEWLKED